MNNGIDSWTVSDLTQASPDIVIQTQSFKIKKTHMKNY